MTSNLTVTILILIDGFLQSSKGSCRAFIRLVTILILIDGFLQFVNPKMMDKYLESHNPYFNRWFSAIEKQVHLMANVVCHNPYFNRWFSAILVQMRLGFYNSVTILILIDGFLQYTSDKKTTFAHE